MRPHNQNLDSYGKLCRERTNKYMVKNRQIQVIENDSGARMRPMPGMVTFSVAGPSVNVFFIPSYQSSTIYFTCNASFMYCNILLGKEENYRARNRNQENKKRQRRNGRDCV